MGIDSLTDYLIAPVRVPHNLGHPDRGVEKMKRRKTLFRRIA